MLSEEYSLCYAEMQDIESWINMSLIKNLFYIENKKSILQLILN
jgi:hypothetical protein